MGEGGRGCVELLNAKVLLADKRSAKLTSLRSVVPIDYILETHPLFR
jgi:hypothetical protein